MRDFRNYEKVYCLLQCCRLERFVVFVVFVIFWYRGALADHLLILVSGDSG